MPKVETGRTASREGRDRPSGSCSAPDGDRGAAPRGAAQRTSNPRPASAPGASSPSLGRVLLRRAARLAGDARRRLPADRVHRATPDGCSCSAGPSERANRGALPVHARGIPEVREESGAVLYENGGPGPGLRGSTGACVRATALPTPCAGSRRARCSRRRRSSSRTRPRRIPTGAGLRQVRFRADEPLRVELDATMRGDGYVVLADTVYRAASVDVLRRPRRQTASSAPSSSQHPRAGAVAQHHRRAERHSAGIESPIGEPLATLPPSVPLLRIGTDANRAHASLSSGQSASSAANASVSATVAPISIALAVAANVCNSATSPT